MDLRGKTALVTGASSGLGEAFARKLAAWGANLVITARRKERLEALAAELEKEQRVKVTVVELDLADPSAPEKLFAATEDAGVAIDVLVNNAGGGIHRRFVDIPWDDTRKQLQLNLVSLTELTWRFARAMLGRDRGWILNVASIGAYTPTPTYATYAAGKAYVRDVTEAIAYELRETNVKVMSLCPGGTTTEFHLRSGHEIPEAFKSTFMSADECAQIGLDALFVGRRNVISGWVNKVGMWMLRFVPRRAMVHVAALSMGSPKETSADE